MIADAKTRRILCTAHAAGSCHDFKLYEASVGSAVSGRIRLKGDSAYQGLLRLHANSQTPAKKPRGGVLTEAEKAHNRRLSRERILIENLNAKVKVFKIVSNQYRNRRKRFALRMALICGIINHEQN